MPANEQINIDITAKDKASKVLGDVADQADALEKADPEVAVSADTSDADRKLGGVDSDIKTLTDQDWELKLRMDLAEMKRQAKATSDLLDSLRKDDVTVDVDADVTKAKRSIGEVADHAKTKGHEGGLEFGETFIRDVGGVMGTGAEGVFADFAAAAESVGLALPEEVMGPLMGALSVGGLAFIAVKKFWDVWNADADKAKKSAAEVAQSLAGGQFTQAAQQINKDYGSLITAAGKFGVSADQTIGFILGTRDSINVTDDAIGGHIQAWKIVKGSLDTAKGAYQSANGSLAAQQTALFKTTALIGGNTDALMEQAKTALPAVQAEILKYIAVQNGIPDQVITTILTDTDPNDVQQVQDQLDKLAADRTSTMHVDIDMSEAIKRINQAKARLQTGPGGSGLGVSSITTTNVSVNMPRGARGSDVVRAVNAYGKRNGNRRAGQ